MKAPTIVAKPASPATGLSSAKPDKMRQTPKLPRKPQSVMTASRCSWASLELTTRGLAQSLGALAKWRAPRPDVARGISPIRLGSRSAGAAGIICP